MYLCFLAFAGASEDSNGLKLLLSPGFSSLKMYYTNFETSYADVAIINTSDSQVRNADTYGSLFAALYGTEVTIPAFNQTFTMIKQ